ncbi:hypothetical protein KSP39_PZI022298 [Platanthera zijinensis]|uniref:Uncharacterized protein n=1 Tax=Platanthera zijinensis TaxID=2320716 RepID=A0AAP0FUW1_9ASPA
MTGTEVVAIALKDQQRERRQRAMGEMGAVNDTGVCRGVDIDDFQLFSGHVAIYLFENDLPKVIVYSIPQLGEEIGPLQNGRAIDFVDPIYSVYHEESQFSSSILRFYYSSMKTHPSVYDYDMTSGISVLKKIQPEV